MATLGWVTWGVLRRGVVALGAVAFVCGLIAQAAVADPDVVGEWHLDSFTPTGDGSVEQDSSGHGNDLLVPGAGAATISDGRYSGALPLRPSHPSPVRTDCRHRRSPPASPGPARPGCSTTRCSRSRGGR